jgi:hypothetical protein
LQAVALLVLLRLALAVCPVQSWEEPLGAWLVRAAGYFLAEWLRLVALPLEYTEVAAKLDVEHNARKWEDQR